MSCPRGTSHGPASSNEFGTRSLFASHQLLSASNYSHELTQLALHVRKHRVGIGRWHRHRHPEENAPHELPRLSAHEGRDDRTVERGDVEGEEGAEDEEERVEGEEGSFFGADGGDHDAEDAREAFVEDCVDLSTDESTPVPRAVNCFRIQQQWLGVTVSSCSALLPWSETGGSSSDYLAGPPPPPREPSSPPPDPASSPVPQSTL